MLQSEESLHYEQEKVKDKEDEEEKHASICLI